MSAYTSEDVLGYVQKWSKPAQLKKLKTTEGVKEFYDDIEYGGTRVNVKFLTPFFDKVIQPALLLLPILQSIGCDTHQNHIEPTHHSY